MKPRLKCWRISGRLGVDNSHRFAQGSDRLRFDFGELNPRELGSNFITRCGSAFRFPKPISHCLDEFVGARVLRFVGKVIAAVVSIIRPRGYTSIPIYNDARGMNAAKAIGTMYEAAPLL